VLKLLTKIKESLKAIFRSVFRYSPTFREKVPVKGRMEAVLRGPDGKVKERRVVENLITNVGDAHVADQMSDQGEAAMSHMAVGTGNGQGAGDNALATELDRNALTSKTQQAAGDDNDVEYIGDWAAGDGTGAITEAGIFNDVAAGNMLCYADFAVINKAAGDALKITWTVTYGAS